MGVVNSIFLFYKNCWKTLLGESDSEPEDSEDVYLDGLINEFTARRGGMTVADSASEIFFQIGLIPRILRWNEGLQDALNDVILATVEQAERFGGKTGPMKRRFAVDLVTRVIRVYEYNGILEPVEDVLIKPVVGVLVDWSVQVLNIHHAWKPVPVVKFPSLFQGHYGKLLKLDVWVWNCWVALRRLIVFPSAYERNLRDAYSKVEPAVKSLVSVLPPGDLERTAGLLITVAARIGQLTAPHISTISDLLLLAQEIYHLSPAELQDLIFQVVKILLDRAYAYDTFSRAVLDSDLGKFFIRQMITIVERILAKNGLLPMAAAAHSASAG
jgi:hypothetical protein